MGRDLKKAYRFEGDMNKEVNFLGKRNIKIYPVIHNKLFKIEIDNNGKKTRGEKVYSTNTINVGLMEAIKYVYNKELKNGR
jgi:hypothetical protein